MPDPLALSRRERQIMDVIYASRESSVSDVLAALADAPSYSAVRTLMRILEEKGHLKHRQAKGKYLYSPTRPRARAARSALRQLLRTFFDNSAARAVTALLDASDVNLSDSELAELSEMIERAKKRGQ